MNLVDHCSILLLCLLHLSTNLISVCCSEANTIQKTSQSEFESDSWEDEELYQEGISDHVLKTFYHLGLLQQKIRQQKHLPASMILEQINQPIHGLATIALKLQYDLPIECRSALNHWIDDFKSQKIWAYRMLDSNGFLPNSGLTSGSVVNFGAYDQCLSIHTMDHIQGQYCLLELKLEKPISSLSRNKSIRPIRCPPQWNETIWMEMQRLQPFIEAFRGYFSVCLPSKCSAKDLQHLTSSFLSNHHQHQTWTVNIQVLHCHSKPESQSILTRMNTNAWMVAMMILIAIVTLFILIFGKFSGHNKNIEDPTIMDCQPKSIKLLKGIQVLNTILIIYWHTYLFTRKTSTIQSLEIIQSWMKMSLLQLVTFGWPLMETMLILSSSITFYSAFEQLQNPDPSAAAAVAVGFWRNFKILATIFTKQIVQRWISLAILVGAFLLLIPGISHGPQSSLVIGQQIQQCCKDWWKILLFASNHFQQTTTTITNTTTKTSSTESVCLVHTWIISVEMQLNLLLFPSLCLLFFKFSAPKYRSIRLIMKSTLVMILAHTGLSIFEYQRQTMIDLADQLYSSLMESETKFVRKLFQYNANTSFYFTPYVCGIFLGYWLSNLKQHDANDPPTDQPSHVSNNTTIWDITWCVLLTLAIVWRFISWLKWPMTISLFALMLALHRMIWSLLVSCFIIVLVIKTYKKPKQNRFWRLIARVMSSEPLQSLSPLCYYWYLVHYLVIITRDSVRRQPIILNHWTMFEEFTLNLVISLALALITQHLMVVPFQNVSLALFHQLRHRIRNPHTTHQPSRNLNHNNLTTCPKTNSDVIFDYEFQILGTCTN